MSPGARRTRSGCSTSSIPVAEGAAGAIGRPTDKTAKDGVTQLAVHGQLPAARYHGPAHRGQPGAGRDRRSVIRSCCGSIRTSRRITLMGGSIGKGSTGIRGVQRRRRSGCGGRRLRHRGIPITTRASTSPTRCRRRAASRKIPAGCKKITDVRADRNLGAAATAIDYGMLIAHLLVPDLSRLTASTYTPTHGPSTRPDSFRIACATGATNADVGSAIDGADSPVLHR